MHRQYVVKFSAPREFSIALDRVCADLRLSKSLVLTGRRFVVGSPLW